MLVDNKNIARNLFANHQLYEIGEFGPLPEGGEGTGHAAVAVLPAPASETERDLLANILKATGLEEGEILALTLPDATSGEELRFAWLQAAHQCKYCIAFGVSPSQLHLKVQHLLYRPLPLNGCQLIFAHSLGEIGEQQQLKKRLWNALKAAFGI